MALTGNIIGHRSGNTAVYIEQDNRAEAFLCDCGYLQAPEGQPLTKVRTLFVSHTHIDHFIDFDCWIAAWVRLGRERIDLGKIACFGPPNFLSNVEGKLRGYTWNLIDCNLQVVCTEIDEDRRRTIRFDSQSGFSAGEPVSCTMGEKQADTVWEDDRLTVRCARLEHKTPSLAYALEEKPVLAVDKEALAKAGLGPGSWIRPFKEAVTAQQPPDSTIETPRGPMPLGELSRMLLREKPGQKIAFVTDTIYNKHTAFRIEQLARGADTLFIEAAFLHRDLDKARSSCHLTARQAGRLARAAGVGRAEFFHFSSRYADSDKALQREAEEAMNCRT